MAKRKTIPRTIRLQVLKKYNNHCAYCGCELDMKTLRVDHLVPFYHGGADDIDNYMPSCRSCNFYKSTLDLEKFRDRLGTMHDRIVAPFIVRLGMQYGIVKI